MQSPLLKLTDLPSEWNRRMRHVVYDVTTIFLGGAHAFLVSLRIAQL